MRTLGRMSFSLILGLALLACEEHDQQAHEDGGAQDGQADGVASDGQADGAGGDAAACEDHCGNLVRDCDETGVDCGGSCAACGPVTVIQDTLDASACSNGCARQVEGGVFHDGGWSPQGFEDRIVYTWSPAVDCGYLKVQIDQFDPASQFLPQWEAAANYVEFIALFESGEENHNTTGTQIDIVYAPCPDVDPAPECHEQPHPYTRYRLKPNNGLVTGCQFGSDVTGCEGHCANTVTDCGETATNACDWMDWKYLDFEYYPWTRNSRYTIEMRFSPSRLIFSMGCEEEAGVTCDPADTVKQEIVTEYPSYPNDCYPQAKTPQLANLFLGRPRIGWGGWLSGPVFTYVELVSHDCSTIDW